MHYINNAAFSHIVIHHYWCNLKYSTSESHAWQKGLEAMAYVPQYLLYNIISKGAKKKINSAGPTLCYTLLPCNK